MQSVPYLNFTPCELEEHLLTAIHVGVCLSVVIGFGQWTPTKLHSAANVHFLADCFGRRSVGWLVGRWGLLWWLLPHALLDGAWHGVFAACAGSGCCTTRLILRSFVNLVLAIAVWMFDANCMV